MPVSRNRDIATILGRSEAANASNVAFGTGSGGGSGGGVTTYDSDGLLPSSGNSIGDFAFSKEQKELYIWDSGDWREVSVKFTAIADILLVGGGGAGGKGQDGITDAGGGGAGGLVFKPNTTILQGTTYTITVGAGGSGYNSTGLVGNGKNGGDTIAFNLTAKGGGGGSGGSDKFQVGSNGGSGGGAALGAGGGGSATQTSQSGESGSLGYGNAGAGTAEGGGGGAGAAGSGFNGGAGLNEVVQGGITYNWVTLFGSGIGDNGYFAGGGAGGATGVGGAGGGANGVAENVTGGAPGDANTGGGGSGANDDNSAAGGNGGSGIVVLRSATQATGYGSATETIVNGYYVYTFTQSSSISF